MASNAEILAQLEKLAEARRPQCVPELNAADEDGDTYCRHCGIGIYVGERRWCQSQLNPIVPILAAFKRLVKIEEAAKAHVDKRRDSWMAAVARGYNKAFATEHWPTIGVIEEGVDALAAALKEPQ